METAFVRVGKQVVVRWADGMQYYGRVTRIDHKARRYCVEFAPGKSYMTLFKDVKEISGKEGFQKEHDLLCEMCHSGHSHKPNEIVICDKCGKGYHQRCHKPKIDGKVLLPHIDWICWRCIHNEGGSGNQRVKSPAWTLPYSLSSLMWDEAHLTNRQETYCYCGGPGEWYNKMIQCAGCKQWFHQACLSCLGEPPQLYGDRFYYFLCFICNAGAEYIVRLPFSLVSATQLVVYHLVLVHQRKYVDFDDELLPLFERCIGYLGLEKSVEDRRGELWRTLEEEEARFASGKEVKKKKGLWSLRGETSPPIPRSFPPRPPKGTKATISMKKGMVVPLSLQSPTKGAPPTAGYGIKQHMIRSGLSKPRTSPGKRPLQGSHSSPSPKKSKTVRCVYPPDSAPPFHDIQQLKLYVQRMRGGTSGSSGTSTGSVALIASGAKYRVLARRVTTDSREEYLIQWL